MSLYEKQRNFKSFKPLPSILWSHMYVNGLHIVQVYWSQQKLSTRFMLVFHMYELHINVEDTYINYSR